MTLGYSDVDVDKVEHARRITLSLLNETNALLEDEKMVNGAETKRYSRLNEKLEAIKYLEDLVLKELRAIFY